jgi:hypothetical protein
VVHRRDQLDAEQALFQQVTVGPASAGWRAAARNFLKRWALTRKAGLRGTSVSPSLPT